MKKFDQQKQACKPLKEETSYYINLMQDKILNLSNDCMGVYIPADEMLNRNKFNWFATLTRNQILKSKLAISYIIKESIIDSSDIYTNYKEQYASNASI